MRNKIQFVLVFILLSFGIKAQTYYYDFNQGCEKAYQQLMELDFDSATFFIHEEKNKHPENLIPVLLENYHDFLRIVIFEDEDLFDQQDEFKKVRLNLWEEGPKDSPWYLSGEAQIKLQWAFARVLFDEYFTAATEINSAYHLLEDNKKKHPDFLWDNMGIGILHAMIGVVPDQYQWAMELFGFYGTIEQGISEVRQALITDEIHPFQQETLFYYTFLRLNLQNDSARMAELLEFYHQPQMIPQIERSPLLSFSNAVLLMRIDNEEAIHFLKSQESLYINSQFYYPIFLLGQALLYQLNPESKKYLKEYVNDYSGKNYKKTALQRLAWMSFIEGDTLQYQEIMRRLKNSGNLILDSDKSAQKEAEMSEEAHLPHLNLLSSRILFDGHYFERALESLSSMEHSKMNDEVSLEYYYRKGRILHESGDYEEALKSYRQAIKEGEESYRYFPGKAALMLGELEENRGNYKAATQAYEKCLELDFNEYRRGIRAKAKAGLQRLKE